VYKQVNILPGGTYSKLCDLAEKQLRNNTYPKIVYFIAGIPDICTLTVIVPKTTLDPIFLIRFSTSDIVFCICKT
jgi:hypothetical protein